MPPRTLPPPADTPATGYKPALLGTLLAGALVKQGFSAEYAVKIAEPAVVACSERMAARAEAYAAGVQKWRAKAQAAAAIAAGD